MNGVTKWWKHLLMPKHLMLKRKFKVIKTDYKIIQIFQNWDCPIFIWRLKSKDIWGLSFLGIFLYLCGFQLVISDTHFLCRFWLLLFGFFWFSLLSRYCLFRCFFFSVSFVGSDSIARSGSIILSDSFSHSDSIIPSDSFFLR